MAIQVSAPADGEMPWTLEVPEAHRRSLAADDLAGELAAAVAEVRRRGDGGSRLWIGHVAPGDDELVARWGFTPYRDLWQLRVPLPAAPSNLPVRPFRPGDGPAVLAVNARAFSWHPEQGAMDADDLRRRQAESWYDPTGFLLHERDGRLAGFCWTKTHPARPAPESEVAMGEIYVIAVDPDFQGQGLGAPLTLAGLAHLHGQGLTVGMLYVESDNHAANAVYRRLGFTHHHTNRAYAADL